MNDWNLKIGYIPTLGRLRLEPQCPHGGDQPTWTVPLTDVLRQTRVTPEQLRAHMAEAATERLPGSNLSTEQLCDDAIGDCTGKTVLDIGGYDGRAAARALENGAKSPVCLDSGQWHHYGWDVPESRPGVLYAGGDLLEWDQEVDLTLLFNVIYHLRDPWGALEHIRSFTKQRLVLCSLVVWDDRPVWYPKAPYEVNPEDDTVYWCPSDSGLVKLLEVTGWKNIKQLGKTTERLVLEASPGERVH